MKFIRYYLVVFFVSLATLIFEIGLMRLFSFIHFYHFAFLVVSISLFGMSTAGTYIQLMKPISGKHFWLWSFLFAISVPLSFAVLNNLVFDPVKASISLMHASVLVIYYIVAGIPFVFSGLIISDAFRILKNHTGKIYFFNLTGSAIGGILSIILVSVLGVNFIFMVGLIGLLSSIISLRNHEIKKYISYFFVLVFFVLLFVPISVNISDYKELSQSLNYPSSEHIMGIWTPVSRIDVVNSSLTRYSPGLSSSFQSMLPPQYGILTDGGNMNAITKVSFDAVPNFLDYIPNSVAYDLLNKSNSRTLILNPGGGLDVNLAFYRNSNVSIAQQNPAITNLLQNDFNEFTNGIFDNVKILNNPRPRDEKYDVIIISLAGNVESSAYGFNENFFLTTDAFSHYKNILTDDGLLVITRWLDYPPRETLRLFSTAKHLGIENIAMYRSWSTTSLLFSKNGFDAKRTEVFFNTISNKSYDVVWFPDDFEPNKFTRFQEPYYYQGIDQIIHNEDFSNDYLFDINPVSDDKPFFHNFFKLSRANEIWSSSDWVPFKDSFFLLIFLLLTSIVLSFLVLIFPLLIKRIHENMHSRKTNLSKPEKGLLFFLCTGLGYLLIEITFISKFILLFNNAKYSAVAVISIMLVISGLGSLFSSRIKNLKISLYTIFFLALFHFLVTDFFINLIIEFNLFAKFIFLLIYISPISFLLGIPFPFMLHRISKKNVAWAWSIDGSMSVVSSVLAVFIALFTGHSFVILLGGFVYLISSFLIK